MSYDITPGMTIEPQGLGLLKLFCSSLKLRSYSNIQMALGMLKIKKKKCIQTYRLTFHLGRYLIIHLLFFTLQLIRSNYFK